MAFWLSTAKSPHLFPWAVTESRFQQVSDLAHPLPSQIRRRSSERAFLQHPVQCRVTSDPSPLWSTPHTTNSSSSVRMETPYSRLIRAPERSLSPQRTKGATRTESGLLAAESMAMKCLNQAYPKLVKDI